MMMIDVLQRRKTLLEKIQTNSAVIFFAAPEVVRSHDTYYPYRQNSDFWYFSLFAEPESALILIKQESEEQGQQFRSIIFNRKKDPQAEIWTGYRLGQEAALQTLMVDEAYCFDDIESELPKLFNGLDCIYHADQLYSYADSIINKTLNTLRNGSRKNLRAPSTVIDWRRTVHEMRLIKSPQEIELIKQATHITALGHLRAMQRCRPNMYEYQLESEILYEFQQNGARFPSYNTIVGGGSNACILHYDSNNQRLNDGDLVLIDAGCEYQYYAGDITRTFPINGKFSKEQRQIYELVLTSQYHAIGLLKPGISIKQVNDEVIRILVEGLIKLGIMSGDIDRLIADKDYQTYYMHGLGHWLGIDVHDVGDYRTPERDRILEENMVLTIEPGLYIAPHSAAPKHYQGIGIRIEDNVLITKNGCDVLTHHVPKDIDAIEHLMANRRQ